MADVAELIADDLGMTQADREELLPSWPPASAAQLAGCPRCGGSDQNVGEMERSNALDLNTPDRRGPITTAAC